MSISRTIALRLIRLGRSLARRTSLDNNPVVLWIYKSVCTFGFGAASHVDVNVRGLSLRMHNDTSIVPGLLNNTYETQALDFFEGALKEGMVVFDVGANMGLYALLASRRVGPTGRVFAFEPVPATLQLLEENLRRNNAQNVEIVRAAVSLTPGRAQMAWSPEALGWSSLLDTAANAVDVEVTTLDAFCKSRGLFPDVIKMDIEGSEWDALRGAEQTLSKDPTILMEFNQTFLNAHHLSPSALLDYLHSRFESVRFVDEEQGGLKPARVPADLGRQMVANLVIKGRR